MGITISSEAHEIMIKTGETRIRRLKIQAPNASKETRIAHIAERTSENIQFEVKEDLLHGVRIADKGYVSIAYRSMC